MVWAVTAWSPRERRLGEMNMCVWWNEGGGEVVVRKCAVREPTSPPAATPKGNANPGV
jgi:hypothetical protein